MRSQYRRRNRPNKSRLMKMMNQLRKSLKVTRLKKKKVRMPTKRKTRNKLIKLKNPNSKNLISKNKNRPRIKKRRKS